MEVDHTHSPFQVKGNHKQERRSGAEQHEMLQHKGGRGFVITHIAANRIILVTSKE